MISLQSPQELLSGNRTKIMSLKSIHFYFDYISPYSYFAWRKLPLLAKKYKRQIEAHPVVFGKLLDKWGQLGPAEIPPKRIGSISIVLDMLLLTDLNIIRQKKTSL